MRRGPLYMIIAALFFTVMIAAVKVARSEMPALEVMTWRGIVTVPLAFFMARRTGMALVNRRVFVMRALLGFCAMTCFYTAARGLAVADLSLIAKLQPVLVGILAPLLLGRRERVGWVVWIALAGGLAGSAILIGPDLAVGSHFGLLAVGAAVFSALTHLCLRVLGRTENADALVFWFQLSLGILSCIGMLLVHGRLPGIPHGLWIPILTIGVCATAGQYFMTRAYQMERATIIAGASYAAPLWAVVVDLVAFSAWPTVYAIAGGTLIIGSGLVFLRREV